MAHKTLSADYEELYEKVSGIDQRSDSFPDRARLDFFASLAGREGGLDVLDLGCGEGRLSLLLERAGHQVTASDIAQGFLDKVIKKDPEIKTVKCNVEEDISVFGGKQFDVIFFLNIIEHLKNPVVSLENLRFLLKEEGRLYIHTPNVCSLRRFLKYIIRGARKADYYNSAHLGDLHFFTYDYLTLEKTLNFIGLKVSRIIATETTLSPWLRLNRFLAGLNPALSDTLLLECRKSFPIDVEKQIEYWKQNKKEFI